MCILSKYGITKQIGWALGLVLKWWKSSSATEENRKIHTFPLAYLLLGFPRILCVAARKFFKLFLFVSWHISFLFNQELYSDKEHELREWEWEGKCVNVNWWTFHNHRISYVQIAWHIQIRLYFIAKPHLFAATFSFSFGLWWLYSIHSGVTRAGYGECIQRIVWMGLVCGVFLCHDLQVTY